MPSIPVHLPAPGDKAHPSPFPEVLQTPLGVVLLELQGKINFPVPDESASATSTEVGRLVFPDYDPASEVKEGPWMKKIFLYVGHQRLQGEVKKLPAPLGLLRRRRKDAMEVDAGEGPAEGGADELEIWEVVRWKLLFKSRPEPVGLAEE